jgi:hypothetical protein
MRPKGHKKTCRCAVCKNIGKRRTTKRRRRR